MDKSVHFNTAMQRLQARKLIDYPAQEKLTSKARKYLAGLSPIKKTAAVFSFGVIAGVAMAGLSASTQVAADQFRSDVAIAGADVDGDSIAGARRTPEDEARFDALVKKLATMDSKPPARSRGPGM